MKVHPLLLVALAVAIVLAMKPEILDGALGMIGASGGAALYTESLTTPYGPRWKTERPPGLPTTARKASSVGDALPHVKRAATNTGLGSTFVAAVVAMARKESKGGTYALPADIFDARIKRAGDELGNGGGNEPPWGTAVDGLRPGGALTSAWGVFNWNRDAWRDGLKSLGMPYRAQFPWNASPTDEVEVPIRIYAREWRRVVSAGGDARAAARGIHLWQHNPGVGFPAFIATGRARGWEEAWDEWGRTDSRSQASINNHLRAVV